MSITDNIHKAAKETLENAGDKKILPFTTDTKEYSYYKASHAPTADPQLRLKIWAKELFLMPRYELIYDVPHTAKGDFVGLVLPYMTVKMYGRHLITLVEELFDHRVEWVREYHPPFWEFEPGKDKETLPCIEKISIENAPMNPRAEAVEWEKTKAEKLAKQSALEAKSD